MDKAKASMRPTIARIWRGRTARQCRRSVWSQRTEALWLRILDRALRARKEPSMKLHVVRYGTKAATTGDNTGTGAPWALSA